MCYVSIMKDLEPNAIIEVSSSAVIPKFRPSGKVNPNYANSL